MSASAKKRWPEVTAADPGQTNRVRSKFLQRFRNQLGGSHHLHRRQNPSLESARPNTMFLARRIAVLGDRIARTVVAVRAMR